MLVNDNAKKCVAFIGYTDQITDNFVPKGTVFFIGKEIDGTNQGIIFAVTAKHVIDKLKSLGINDVQLRLNHVDGGIVTGTLDINDWHFHTGTDEIIDVAVAAMGIPADVDHRFLSTKMALTNEVIQANDIGVGEEVFMTGLFVHHYGKQKNIPIVRVGNIAAMVEEKVECKLGLIDAYLIEARSIGGLSGSPVFINLGDLRNVKGELKISEAPGGVFYLLGLMHGHYDEPQNSELNEDSVTEQAGKINTGIGIVVPVSKIMQILNQQSVLEKVADIIKRRKQLISNTATA